MHNTAMTTQTTTIKDAKKNNMGETYRYSLQNLTTEQEYLSYCLEDLIEIVKSDDSDDDFLFWDNEENCDITVHF